MEYGTDLYNSFKLSLKSVFQRVLQMAQKFPHARAVGIDLAPVPVESAQIPPNCQFEIDDANLGLQHFQGQFDLVHMRSVCAGVRQIQYKDG